MKAPELASVSLDDKYLQDGGVVLMSGRQALVRLPMFQRDLDRARGLHTAGFITGYRGSPLGGYDLELERAGKLLAEHDIVFKPGLNEDLAATAICGTQQLGFVPGRKVDGVFALWYGKGPGVDRSGDPFKHGNRQGVEPYGGVLLVFGDDHAGKSSTTAHQSEQALAANEIPVFYPSSVGEIIEYGLAGWALSRYSGLFVGLKVVNETAETTATVTLDPASRLFTLPDEPLSPDAVAIRNEHLNVMGQDVRLIREKRPRAHAFVRANRMDRIVFGAQRPEFAIVTAGKAFGDTISALAMLGLDHDSADQLGIGVYKVALISPLEPTGLKEIAADSHELLFVEEKRAFMESQAAALLYTAERSSRITGKHDPEGGTLLPQDVLLDPLMVAVAIGRRLAASFADLSQTAPKLMARIAELESVQAAVAISPATSVARRPTFCAGCPHNVSTKVPENSIGMTGIGCHAMVSFLPDRNPLPLGHMGGEGANWIGISPFTDTPHVFQNLGDGTYNHSGSLAIRAAVQAQVNITYKILYNDAVAMTGGQAVEGAVAVHEIVHQLQAEGIAQPVVVSDQPERFTGHEKLPAGTELRHRDDMDAVQRQLRDIPGVTAIIYDQVCAAEKRRRRKRNEYPDPDRRIFINVDVCEGCGDCSVQSECVAVQPLETELGRKRKIDQSACNKDFSCLNGFCPSFVTVEGGRLRTSAQTAAALSATNLTDPRILPLADGFSFLATGVGGTGVVTITSILAMAAHLEGKGASVFDMTGLSQKGGAVFSHLKISSRPGTVGAVEIGRGQADLVLGCDAIAATSAHSIETIDPARTVVLLNEDVVAIADYNRRPDLAFDIDSLATPLRNALQGRDPFTVKAETLALRHLGNAIGANMLMLGSAWQRGIVPLSRAAIHRAIGLNGVAIQFNIDAFELGRAAAAQAETGVSEEVPAELAADDDLDAFVMRRIADLTIYRDTRYAQRYENLVALAIAAERRVDPDADDFGWTVARAAYKVMAYKDEYEVARLYTDGRFQAALDAQFEPGYRLKFHLAPPTLRGSAAASGRPPKRVFGASTLTLFRLLVLLKKLRETPFDIFGWSEERRQERALRDVYCTKIAELCPALTRGNYRSAVDLARTPLSVRGFGPVKAEALQKALGDLRQTAMPAKPGVPHAPPNAKVFAGLSKKV